jgi:hypothetical protein
MSAPDQQLPPDWEAFKAARDRFYIRVRPEALPDARPSPCPDTLPQDWIGSRGDSAEHGDE